MPGLKSLSFVFFPKLRFLVLFAQFVYSCGKKQPEEKTMNFPMRLAIGSACTLVFIILVGFVGFPKMIKSKVKGMVNLKPGMEIREMFVKVPFPLSFNVYIFSVLNPAEVQGGAKPHLKEMGPFCYNEWKTKINVQDNEGDDTMSYDPVDTFETAKRPKCLSADTLVTIPHPMILGMVNTILRQKPGALTLANKAIKSIWSNPSSLFITIKARDLLFDGVVIHCGVSDFAGKAICTNLKAEPSLTHLGGDDLGFSLLGPKNGTAGKRIKAFRGTQDFHKVGRIIEFDGSSKLNVWNDSKCDAIVGTDGTIFPPMLKKEEGLASLKYKIMIYFFWYLAPYSSLLFNYIFISLLGDQSKNPDEKCFCTTPATCLKKGLMDLYKCAKIPLYVSLPHFYDSHETYLKGVKGLKPDAEKHGIRIMFELLTGSPLSARKRLQFNMPLEPNPKVELFHNFTPTVLPIFWVEEAIDLNNTFTQPLKTMFLSKKLVNVVSYLVLLMSIGAFCAAGYLYFKSDDSMNVTSVQKVQPDQNGNRNTISTVFNGNHARGRDNEAYEDKY
uniref:Sensory neuron membrane protein 1a n=1 Tax=Dendroctonus adjunctus TaxID=77157 RepID=A0A7U3U7Z8_9CUCU|nr:Sensory neuron membrane protein 1a [Dendroctonus adjunctus]